MDDQQQKYTLNMITVDGWKEFIGNHYTSQVQAEMHGESIKASMKDVYKDYEVRETQPARRLDAR